MGIMGWGERAGSDFDDPFGEADLHDEGMSCDEANYEAQQMLGKNAWANWKPGRPGGYYLVGVDGTVYGEGTSWKEALAAAKVK